MKVTKQLPEEYPFFVRPLSKEEGKGFWVEFPDFPYCWGDGETIEEAVADGQDALKCVLLTNDEFGRPIPKPGSSTGQWRQRVPKSMHLRLTAAAAKEGVSLNSLVMAFIAEGLARLSVGKKGKAA